MKNLKQISALTIVLLFAAMPATLSAQTRERFGISAKAGGVNTVVGHVMVEREGQKPQLLTNKDNLSAGETVISGMLSNAEVLLNPGSYFRMGENSEFQFKDISLDHLELELVKGSAIIEATGVADMDLGIKVTTAHGEFRIVRSGVYRIDVQPGFAELSVRKGRASYGPNKTDVVKGGKMVTLTKGTALVAKLNKQKDAFDAWSKQRAELLAKANLRLFNRSFNAYMAGFRGWDSWFWGPRRFGVWTFSPRAGCYTFLPFYGGWSSPYGHFYGSVYSGGHCCNSWRPNGSQTPYTVGGTIVTGGGSGSPGGNGGGSSAPPPPTVSTPVNNGLREMDVSGRTTRKVDP